MILSTNSMFDDMFQLILITSARELIGGGKIHVIKHHLSQETILRVSLQVTANRVAALARAYESATSRMPLEQ